MSARSSTVIALLYTAENGSVEGATRFQKLVFLAQKESGIGNSFDFEPGKFGPFSIQLASELEQLAARGYIEQNPTPNAVGNDRITYRLTGKGIRVAKDLLKEYEPFFDQLREINETYGSRRLDLLLNYVYTSYPDFATETELDVEQLGRSDELSQFLVPDENSEYESLDEVERIRGEIASTGTQFERSQIQLIDLMTITAEEFQDGRTAVYWPTTIGFEEFCTRARRDANISPDAQAEARFAEEEGWTHGTLSEIVSIGEHRDDCVFIAVAASEEDYEVTWDRLVRDENGTHNELTVLFTGAKQPSDALFKTVLNTYLREDLRKAGQRESEDPGSISFTQSLDETTRYLVG